MPQPPPPEARERILDAAEAAFSEHGLAGARVAAIAANAEVNKAMLYYYFGSKDGLYTAVLERMADMVVSMAERAMASSDAPPEERLFSFIEGYRDLLTEHPSFLRIATRELLSGGELIIPLFVARAPHILGTFWQCVREGQAAGTINPELDFRAIMPVLLAPYIMFNVGSTVFGDRIPIDPEQVRSLFYDTAMAVARDGILSCPPEEVA
jgi:AcrR family transcriptional regulator